MWLIFLTTLAVSSSQRSPSYDCGRVTPQADPLVLGGARARHGELPWHVGVYQKTSRSYRQICGGSIVSRKLVISAAHCFWSADEKLAPAARYAVAAGKIYKPWDESHDPDAQHSNLSELVIPSLFRGVDRNFAEDLALLVLEQPFRYRPYLRPVCLDFEPRLEARQLRPGSKGKVAGWGLTSASGKRTTVLNVIDLPVVSTEECLLKSPKNYWEYITFDKICAGYDSGSATLCQGDSGGGLSFPHLSALGVERYFLRGVVSTSPSSDALCNAFAITSFTRISVHRSFIERRYSAETVEEPEENLPLNTNSSSAGSNWPVANSSITNSPDTDNDPNRAPPCNTSLCVLPDCFCSADGTAVPGGLLSTVVPQMVTITFNDAINSNNIELYNNLFNGKRKNPNGCAIKATFFVSHKFTDYSAVQEMHRKGHEIAVHSVTHKDDESFWSNASVDDWTKEMAGMRSIIQKFANVSDSSVLGVRAPHLRVGGNNQFTMMEEQAFLYDSSITAPLATTPLWPYTLYHRMPHRCHGNQQNCPTRSQAVWEMVLNELDPSEDRSKNRLPGCAMVDSCVNFNSITGLQFNNFLNRNFDRHYTRNRAPLGLHFHASWFKRNPELFEAFLSWLDETLSEYKDVYFVSMNQVIEWIQNPRTLREALRFEPWQRKCAVEGGPACKARTCKLASKELPGETINLQTCSRCPAHYPWLRDPTGDERS